ncbi:MAG: hypothetical protein AB7D36_07710, partial [Oscillospiraceae bacterium]
KRLAKSTALGPQKGSATNHAGADLDYVLLGALFMHFLLDEHKYDAGFKKFGTVFNVCDKRIFDGIFVIFSLFFIW